MIKKMIAMKNNTECIWNVRGKCTNKRKDNISYWPCAFPQNVPEWCPTQCSCTWRTMRNGYLDRAPNTNCEFHKDNA